VVNAVEEPTDVCVNDPVDVLAPALLAKLSQCVVRTAAFPKAVGAILKILLI